MCCSWTNLLICQGELLHAGLQLIGVATGRMADPASFYDIPTYRTATGGDWNGFQASQQPVEDPAPRPGESPAEDQSSGTPVAVEGGQGPVVPRIMVTRSKSSGVDAGPVREPDRGC